MTEPEPVLRRAQRKYQAPVVYKIGEEVTQERYEEIMVAVGDWFKEWRTSDEPMADARVRIRCCLEGKTLDGKPWFTAWSSTFAARMRMLCRYDIDKMEPIRKGDEKRKQRKIDAKNRLTEQRRRTMAGNDDNIPELTRAEMHQGISYGSAALPITEAEQRLWVEYRDAYLQQFPQLRTINAKGELGMLCDLQVVHERNRLKLLKGDKSLNVNAMLDTSKQVSELKKALGIHPSQLVNEINKERGGSIAEAAAKFDALPRELRDKFFLEELLLLFQAYITPSPRGEGDGFQIDEIGLFGQTRCRTCSCSKCGTKNYVGITFPEIRDYLVDKGVIEPLDPPLVQIQKAEPTEPLPAVE